ncbi:MAG: flagellar hook-length control protein FliK [Syntrophaceae bacterium]|nr:flagellar hook-length control protein FliK [Syntrophaceae bacterium]
MINVALQNNGTSNAQSLHLAVGNGNLVNVSMGKDNASSGESLLPFSFSVILSKIINKASQSKGQDSGNSMVEAAGMTAGDKVRSPHFMLKIEDAIPDQENSENSSNAVAGTLLSLVSFLENGIEQSGAEDLTLEIDLQALLDMIQSGKINELNQTETDGSDETELFLTSLLQVLIAPPVNQDGDETAMTLGDKLQFLDETEGANRGNKVFLTVPKDLLQGFVLNKNGQPHFALNEMEANPDVAMLLEVNEPDTSGQLLSNTPADQISKESAFRLVRINTQATASSPQGALLAAAEGLQKSMPSDAAPMDFDAGDAETKETPLPHQTMMKNTGERSARGLLLDVKPADAGAQISLEAKGITPDGDPDAITTNKGADAFKEVLLREDNVKSAMLISGKESTQWVPLAGATSPQLSPEAGTILKGVFIPMDQLVQEAGALLEKGAGKVQMTLQPPSLGTINMDLMVRSNRVELVLTANHAEVQQLLQANSDQLKNALTNQGFQIDQMSVLLRRESLGFNFGGHSLWQEGAGQQPGNGNGISHRTSESEAMIPVRDYGTGSISIFA